MRRSFVPACVNGHLDMKRNFQETTPLYITVLFNVPAFRFVSLNLLFAFCNKNSFNYLETCLDSRKKPKTNKSLLLCPFKWLSLCVKCDSYNWLWIATPTQVCSQMQSMADFHLVMVYFVQQSSPNL